MPKHGPLLFASATLLLHAQASRAEIIVNEQLQTTEMISTDILRIGYGAWGQLLQSPGSHVFARELLTVGENGGDGLYLLSAEGDLQSNVVSIGLSGGHGTLLQQGSRGIVTQVLNIGTLGGTGVYEISGGHLTTQALTVGESASSGGVGRVIQNTGRAAVGAFNLNPTGHYELRGGSLESYPGNVAGTFTQSGGVHMSFRTGLNIGQPLGVGQHGDPAALYTLKAGWLLTNNTTIRSVGNLNTAQKRGNRFIQEGGFHTVKDTFYIERTDAQRYTSYNPSQYLLRAGSLSSDSSVIGESEEIFDQRALLFDQSGGQHKTKAMTLGENGIYRLSGGALTTESSSIHGSFEQLDGTHVASGRLQLSEGFYYMLPKYLLQAGSLETGTTALTDGGQFEQRNGTHTVHGALLLGDGSASIYDYDDYGEYRLADGVLQTLHSAVNYSSLFQQLGGLHAITGDLHVGASDSKIDQSEYVLANGQLETGNTYVGIREDLIGKAGLQQNSFTQHNGRHLANGLLSVGGNSFYDLRGGLVAAARTQVFQGAHFEQAGGTQNVSNSLELGLATGGLAGSGHYTLSNGSLSTQQTTIFGESRFTQTNGEHSVHGTLALGPEGSYSSNTVRYQLSGGTLSTHDTQIGAYAQFAQSGGDHHVEGQLQIGDARRISIRQPNGKYDPPSQYRLEAGTLSAEHETIKGLLTQSGGQNSTQALEIESGGSYRLSGGSLQAEIVHTVSQTVLYGLIETPSFDFNGGTLAVHTFHGDLINAGGRLSTESELATTEVLGNYTQAGAGSLLIDWGAGGHDLVNVDGTANLAGKLTVSLWDDYLPSYGESIVFMTAGSLLGQFDEVLLPMLAGYAFSISYGDNQLALNVLEASEVPLPGAWALMASSLGLLGWGRRRQAQASA